MVKNNWRIAKFSTIKSAPLRADSIVFFIAFIVNYRISWHNCAMFRKSPEQIVAKAFATSRGNDRELAKQFGKKEVYEAWDKLTQDKNLAQKFVESFLTTHGNNLEIMTRLETIKVQLGNYYNREISTLEAIGFVISSSQRDATEFG